MESYPRKLALPGMVAERFTCGPPPSSSGPQKLDQGPRNPGPGSSPLEHIFAPIWAVPLFGRARLYPTDSERSDRQTAPTLGANAAARPRHRCRREEFKPPSCAVPSGAPRTNELFTPRSACARRSDRPKHLRRMLAARRDRVHLSPSTRERVSPGGIISESALWHRMFKILHRATWRNGK